VRTDRRKERPLLILGIALVLVAGVAVLVGFALFAPGGGSSQTGAPGIMNATCSSVSNDTSSSVEHVANGGNGAHAYFLIVAADPRSPFAGFNGSYYVPTNETWPTLNVHLGQTVSIHVINCASGEAHGFAITHYDDNSIIAVQPGHSYDVTFTASEAGTFRIYCDIFCAIHPFMQNGALVVS
jgi:FtsP/CotA-like multicopper oxidase with cupredoxin domain